MRGPGRHWLIIAPPLLFLLVFLLIPFAIAFKISLADSAIAVPPFTKLVTLGQAGHAQIAVSAANYQLLASDRVYLLSYVFSLRTAFFATCLCLLGGYPIAYAIARAPRGLQPVLLMLIMLPFWTSFLLRVYALEGIIADHGLINTVLLRLGLIAAPLRLLNTPFAVYIGIVYSYLPFMVLPLYAALERLDMALLEASADLGAAPWRSFLHITLPLSARGVAAGAMLTFIPAIGEFVIPSLLGGPNSLMIGRVLWDEFFANHNWPVAAAVATVFVVLLAGPIALYQHLETKARAA